MTRALASTLVLLSLHGCSTKGTEPPSLPPETPASASQSVTPTTVTPPLRRTATHTPTTMRPYSVHGRRYYPTVVHQGDRFTGRASWYGPNFHGKLTSNGERYDMHAATAAHKTLPMNTVVRVTNTTNGNQTVVRINDRGPFVASRIIDLSRSAAEAIDMVGVGTAPVELEVIGFADPDRPNLSIEALRRRPHAQVINAFYVQIASFRRFEGAMLTQEKHDGFGGYKAIIKDMEVDAQRLFRIWLGTFQSEAEARDFIKTSPFEQAFIVRE